MTLKDKAQVRILVVDDEQGMRDLLSYELGAQGYHVSTAQDGMEAVEKAKKSKFQLVITDLKMPKMGGAETLEAVKKIDPNTEVIMATGFASVEGAVDAMKKGAYDFIQKPYNIAEVLVVIEKALEKSRFRALLALYESSKAVFSTIKLEELLTIIMDLIQEVLLADEGSLMLLGEDGKLSIAASRGIDPETASKVHLAIGERVAGKAAQERREMLLVNGLEQYPEFEKIEPNLRIGSSIVIPLVYNDTLLGVLNLNRLKERNRFTPDDLAHASIFAAQVSQAVQNAQVYQILEKKIEELNQTKSQLVESEKLASIGRLIAGVAHELNNPLTSVIGFTDLMIQASSQGEFKEQLGIVFSEAQRCKRIVHDLLVFAKWKKPVMKPVELTTIIDETISALSLELDRNGVKLNKKYTECRKVVADDSQLKQVFANIIMNATHALQEIKGSRVIEIQVKPVKDNVHIIISDNGPGVPKENQNKVFDPFFSTKEVGKGTGLGLSLCYGIVKAHGGRVWVESEQGKGASFILEIPTEAETAENNEEPKPVAVSQAIAPVLKGKRVLVIEDEPAIQNFLKRILTAQGCVSQSATDGQDALSKLMAGEFDIVLCDYRLPLMNGRQIYEKFKELRPRSAAHFVFVTGSTGDKELDSFLGENKLHRLMKPFTSADLLGILNKIPSKG